MSVLFKYSKSINQSLCACVDGQLNNFKMIDLPENEIREKHKPLGLVGFVNVLKAQNNQTVHENKNKFPVKKAVYDTVSNTTTSNVTKEKNDEVQDNNEEDLVNYKVGRLVMSILKEFKVSTLLERFEKVLVENANISENENEETKLPNSKNSVPISDRRKKVVRKENPNYANHRGTYSAVKIKKP